MSPLLLTGLRFQWLPFPQREDQVIYWPGHGVTVLERCRPDDFDRDTDRSRPTIVTTGEQRKQIGLSFSLL